MWFSSLTSTSDSCYNRYTWARAVNVLRHDPRTLDALRTLACGIAAAVNVGAVASKWGGYFGQEWLELGLPAELTPLPLAAEMLGHNKPPVHGSVGTVGTPTADMAQRLSTLEAQVKLLLQHLPEGTKPSAKVTPPTRSQHEHDHDSMLAHGEDCAHDDCAHDDCAHDDCTRVHGHGSGHAAEVDASPEPPDLDVIVIGAGAAGIGCASTLTNIFGLEPDRVLLLDRGESIGTSFRMWPEEMRFISYALHGLKPRLYTPLLKDQRSSLSSIVRRSTSRVGPAPSISTPLPTARRPRTRCTRSTHRARSTLTTWPRWLRRRG